MRLYAVLFIGFLLLSQHASSQERSWREIFATAIFFYDEGEYQEALYNYELLHERDTNNADVNFRIGMCYMSIPGQEVEAIPYLEKSLESIEVNYRDYSVNNAGAPLHAMFYLGKAYRLSNQLNRAVEIIEQFKSSPYFLQYNPNVVERELQTIQRAKIMQDRPLDVTFTRFSDQIPLNSPALHPVLSGDGKTLVYLSQQSFYDAVMMLEKVGNSWTQPVNISAQIQSDGAFYPVALSYDGQELYLVKKLDDGSSDLYVSQQQERGWSVATPLSVNSRKIEKGATVSADGKTLYFSSNRRRGNHLNIFASTRNDIMEEWSRPSNLRRPINTDLNETSPQLTSDGKYFFFSSQGHYNIGGYDIFFVEKRTNRDWSEPVNLGYPINTTNDNLYYFPIDRYQGIMSLQKDKDRNPTLYLITINP